VKGDGERWDKNQYEIGIKKRRRVRVDSERDGRCRRTGSPGTPAAPTCSQTRYLRYDRPIARGNSELFCVIHNPIEEKDRVVSFVFTITAFRWGVERCLVIHVIHVSDIRRLML
jgi:hypothetical protein